MIPFNKPPFVGSEKQHILDVLGSGKISGDGAFGHRCQNWFIDTLGAVKTLLTPSCTHALEMAALLIDVQADDEIIMPSYTFVSTANAFVLRGAKIVFVDIDPSTMNINADLIEAAITERTKAIVPVHYAGVGCDMDKIMQLAEQYQLFVIEDAAQGMMSRFKGKMLGTIGHLGAYSFHETKNYTSGGEGGLLIINDSRFIERAEIIREKGTNRSQFFRGMVDKYTWTDVGSSYLPSELQCAYLWGQLENAELINQDRLSSWQRYASQLCDLETQGHIVCPHIPHDCMHNAHMFYIKVADLAQRTALLNFLKEKQIGAVFHYVPLHSSPFGMQHCRFISEDQFTTQESEKLIRLPLWYGISTKEIDHICNTICEYFNKT
ncbi:dTDP-4-amino-4,6-dideoxygalactose transaminase [Acinetobacter indicus]|uniref:dTDP-4-amino-4,6-dideoxygalactose transaminase n=1 Tax=Acinetobacter indicus TaxID=756892 RepID=UPI001444463E|nr:dTDP-4-amino-4,6-dideoxygalactose transaminase [Acinetobacter indicus]